MSAVSHAVGSIVAPRSILSPSQLKAVPSIFAKRASPKMGENYTFIPTDSVIKALDKIGMAPVYAAQRKSKSAAYARHLLRFASKSDLTARKVGEVTPEIVVGNSHNGRSALSVHFGLFRMVCANGLVVADSQLSALRCRHMGDIEEVMQRVTMLLSHTGEVVGRVEAMRCTMLTKSSSLQFATAALAMRYADDAGKVSSPITATDLLVPRRKEDTKMDLWSVFNVVQENMLRGGLIGKSTQGRRVQTRAVVDVRKNVMYNAGLWSLAAALVK
jgi:Domain of unknown function (DUF932)